MKDTVLSTRGVAMENVVHDIHILVKRICERGEHDGTWAADRRVILDRLAKQWFYERKGNIGRVKMKVSRRGVLTGALSGSVLPAKASSYSDDDQLEAALTQVVEHMRFRHGGEWRAKIDHAAKMVAINQVSK